MTIRIFEFKNAIFEKIKNEIWIKSIILKSRMFLFKSCWSDLVTYTNVQLSCKILTKLISQFLNYNLRNNYYYLLQGMWNFIKILRVECTKRYQENMIFSFFDPSIIFYLFLKKLWADSKGLLKFGLALFTGLI